MSVAGRLAHVRTRGSPLTGACPTCHSAYTLLQGCVLQPGFFSLLEVLVQQSLMSGLRSPSSSGVQRVPWIGHRSDGGGWRSAASSERPHENRMVTLWSSWPWLVHIPVVT